MRHPTCARHQPDAVLQNVWFTSSATQTGSTTSSRLQCQQFYYHFTSCHETDHRFSLHTGGAFPLNATCATMQKSTSRNLTDLTHDVDRCRQRHDNVATRFGVRTQMTAVTASVGPIKYVCLLIASLCILDVFQNSHIGRRQRSFARCPNKLQQAASVTREHETIRSSQTTPTVSLIASSNMKAKPSYRTKALHKGIHFINVYRNGVTTIAQTACSKTGFSTTNATDILKANNPETTRQKHLCRPQRL
jgi:hypothetical protein